MKRSLTLTPEVLRAYSRGGNFHTDPDAAARLGYDRLLAAGMQVAGPAYGALVDKWGDAFLAGGEINLKFVGGAYGGETVDADVTFSNDDAEFAVVVQESGITAVVGHAHRSVR